MKRLTACVLACALFIGLSVRVASAQMPSENTTPSAVSETSLCATSASARSGSDPKEPTANPAPAAEKKQTNEKLKADVTKMVADAKAGTLKMPAQHFPQPKRNNLSTGAKVAIVAGIAGAIIFIILWYTTGPGSD